jgi:hypothetical protein
MDRRTEEFRLLLGMAGVTLVTLALLLFQLADLNQALRP